MTCIIEHRAAGAMAALYGADRTACAICKLPIGVPCDPEPSTITPDVAIEIRAAEIASRWEPIGGFLAHEESRGWCNIDERTQEPTRGWLAGFLAHAIVSQRDEP